MFDKKKAAKAVIGQQAYKFGSKGMFIGVS
jgi:hypothetical protein